MRCPSVVAAMRFLFESMRPRRPFGHATYSVRPSRYECGPQVLDQLPPDERAGYGPAPPGTRDLVNTYRD